MWFLLVGKSYDILTCHGNIMGFRPTWLKKIIRFSEGTHFSPMEMPCFLSKKCGLSSHVKIQLVVM